MPKITKRVVDALPAKGSGQDRFVWDSELRGFGIRIKPSGAKTFLIQYRNVHGQTRRMVIGRVGTLTPEEARTLARDALAGVAKGADPSAERHAARKAMKVAELCDWYVDAAEKGHILGRSGHPIKASTLAMDRSRIETHVKPLLGSRAVQSLTTHDIEKMQADIAAGKTARKRSGRGGEAVGGPGAASRTAGMVRTIFGHAKHKRLIPTNPASGMRRLADKKRDRRLSPEELETLGRAIQEASAAGENRTALAAIRFLLLTGFRRMETLALHRSWLDPKARCVRFPDTKSRVQVRPIGRAAIECLAEADLPKDSEWVFPADRGDGHFVGVVKVLDRVCAGAGLTGVTPHTLRHTFASVAGELGFTEMTVGALIGHKARGVTQRYVHLDAALLVAADRTSQVIAALLDGKQDSGTVVPFAPASAAG